VRERETQKRRNRRKKENENIMEKDAKNIVRFLCALVCVSLLALASRFERGET